jgi:Transglycosylase SLT domain
VTSELHSAIDTWVAAGTEPGKAARPTLLRAVRQQKVYRQLLDKPRVYRQVRELLPHSLRVFADKTVLAGTRLRRLVTPLDGPPEWEIHRPAPARRLLRFYRLGERRFDIPWEVLASLNFVESRFGRILGPSSAGAEGPMQFLPSTWAVYGNGGDINDPHDAILGAARYLSASGAPARMWDALFAYNRSNDYVKAILVYARQMMRDPRAFYGYYHWQVYVLTEDGDLQLSGPGADV